MWTTGLICKETESQIFGWGIVPWLFDTHPLPSRQTSPSLYSAGYLSDFDTKFGVLSLSFLMVFLILSPLAGAAYL
jgi:hypothetical protein